MQNLIPITAEDAVNFDYVKSLAEEYNGTQYDMWELVDYSRTEVAGTIY